MSIKAVKNKIKMDLENTEYIESPTLPDLTFKPDFMIDSLLDLPQIIKNS